jgi:hypothetical protein
MVRLASGVARIPALACGRRETIEFHQLGAELLQFQSQIAQFGLLGCSRYPLRRSPLLRQLKRGQQDSCISAGCEVSQSPCSGELEDVSW